MKKYIIIFLIFIISFFALSSCVDKSDENDGGDEGAQITLTDGEKYIIGKAFGSAENFKGYGALTEEEKESLFDAGAEFNLRLSVEGGKLTAEYAKERKTAPASFSEWLREDVPKPVDGYYIYTAGNDDFFVAALLLPDDSSFAAYKNRLKIHFTSVVYETVTILSAENGEEAANLVRAGEISILRIDNL
jgi:hypothetical protein